MPWTGEQFRQRHAHHLSPEQAEHAAAIANGMLKSGAPEGTAIATGIARAKGKARKPKKHTEPKPFGSLAP